MLWKFCFHFRENPTSTHGTDLFNDSYCSQLAVYTSAYPLHYKEAFASCTILLFQATKVCQTPLTACLWDLLEIITPFPKDGTHGLRFYLYAVVMFLTKLIPIIFSQCQNMDILTKYKFFLSIPYWEWRTFYYDDSFSRNHIHLPSKSQHG